MRDEREREQGRGDTDRERQKQKSASSRASVKRDERQLAAKWFDCLTQRNEENLTSASDVRIECLGNHAHGAMLISIRFAPIQQKIQDSRAHSKFLRGGQREKFLLDPPAKFLI